MNAIVNQIANANKAAVENMLTMANTLFASTERLAALNLNVARSAMEDNAANTKALLQIKDPQALVSLTTGIAQPGMEKVVAYSRSLYEILNDTTQELTKVVESQAAEFNSSLNTVLDKAAQDGPAGSDVAVNAVKSAIAAASSAYGNMGKLTKQAVEMTEANLANTVASVSPAAKPSAGKAAANASTIKGKKAA
jgi:phasin family protein